MSTHKYIGRVCWAALALVLAVTALLLGGEALGLQAASPAAGYEARLFDASIVLGRLDGSFDGEAVIQRTDGAILLLRLVREVDRQLWGAETPVTLHIVSEAGEPLCPDQTVTARVNYYLPGYVDETELTGYALREDLLTLTAVSSVQDTYTLVYVERPTLRTIIFRISGSPLWGKTPPNTSVSSGMPIPAASPVRRRPRPT